MHFMLLNPFESLMFANCGDADDGIMVPMVACCFLKLSRKAAWVVMASVSHVSQTRPRCSRRKNTNQFEQLVEIALTRLIFPTNNFRPLGKRIAMFADCPLECSECHKLFPSTLITSPSFLFQSGYHEESSFFNGRMRTSRYDSNVCISRSKYIWGNNKQTAFDETNECIESRKGTWCLLCWEDWHRQKRMAFEALIVRQFPHSFLRTMSHLSIFMPTIPVELGLDSVACETDEVCPWILLGEAPYWDRTGSTFNTTNFWYWAPQPRSLWDISNMTSTIVQRSQTTSFKDVCAQDGLMVVMHNGRPTLYCAVCGKFGTQAHFNHVPVVGAGHKKMCTQFQFVQRRGIVFRPGDEDDEHEYTTSLLSFYQQIVLYPLDWGMDELTKKLMEIEHRRLELTDDGTQQLND